jgi:hypothetical protein
MEICTRVDSLSWAPHPIAEGVEIKPLVTKNDGLDVTCVLVKIPAGKDIPEHRKPPNRGQSAKGVLSPFCFTIWW